MAFFKKIAIISIINISLYPLYSCYDLKQFSKVNLSVYFLPAIGGGKVIKIRRFSNETAIVKTF
ncbi:MAG: hypothetical protein LBR79_00670 [Oscillospiraceae bacterium]|nr:hypothetical protein [Oscillospiraceae bacterium]